MRSREVVSTGTIPVDLTDGRKAGILITRPYLGGPIHAEIHVDCHVVPFEHPFLSLEEVFAVGRKRYGVMGARMTDDTISLESARSIVDKWNNVSGS